MVLRNKFLYILILAQTEHMYYNMEKNICSKKVAA